MASERLFEFTQHAMRLDGFREFLEAKALCFNEKLDRTGSLDFRTEGPKGAIAKRLSLRGSLVVEVEAAMSTGQLKEKAGRIIDRSGAPPIGSGHRFGLNLQGIRVGAAHRCLLHRR
jgi:hypothetical protein